MAEPTISAELTPYTRTFTRSPVLRTAIGELLGRHETDDAAPGDSLRAALAWVARAQDACADGAVAGGYRVLRGWRCGDLVTTAAAIPLFAEASLAQRDRAPLRRAVRAAAAVEALLRAEPRRPVAELAEATASAAALVPHLAAPRREAALDRAARLAEQLGEALTRGGLPSSGAERWLVAASAASALCTAAETTGEHGFALQAERLLDGASSVSTLGEAAAALARTPGTRWPAVGGVAALPTLLRDARRAAAALGRDDVLASVAAECEVLVRRFELRRRIAVGQPRIRRARGARRFSPLAWSSAALLWIEEFERTGDPRPLNAALSAIDGLVGAQRRRRGVQDVDGAVPSAVPRWPRLAAHSYDGLAAVQVARALLARRRALGSFASIVRGAPAGGHDVPRAVRTPPDATAPATPARVVVYAAPDIHRAPPMLERWREWGFVPEAVVMERRPPAPLLRRIRDRVASDGVRETLRRALRRAIPAREAPRGESTTEYCARRGIPVVDVGALDAPETATAVAALAPDLAIHVGRGILRAPLLGVPRLGTLNVHNGILPWFRGMNVAEWARLVGEPVGCTVHLVDPGIDTGDILLVREVDVSDARSIDALRDAVDRAQAEILGEVVRHVWALGRLPRRRPQRADEGRQFFTMHETLRRRLERELSRAAEGSVLPGGEEPSLSASR